MLLKNGFFDSAGGLVIAAGLGSADADGAEADGAAGGELTGGEAAARGNSWL